MRFGGFIVNLQLEILRCAEKVAENQKKQAPAWTNVPSGVDTRDLWKFGADPKYGKRRKTLWTILNHFGLYVCPNILLFWGLFVVLLVQCAAARRC